MGRHCRTQQPSWGDPTIALPYKADSAPPVTGSSKRRGAVGAVFGALIVLTAAIGPPANAATVQVLPGQNLTEIAQAGGTAVSWLIAANGIHDPNLILANTLLVVPDGTDSGPPSSVDPNSAPTVVVGLGDNLTAIAARYGTTVAALAETNGISDPDLVVAGSLLKLPTTSDASGVVGSLLAPAPISDTPWSPLPPRLLAHPDRLALRPVFARWAAAFGVPADLLEAMCWWESGWQSGVMSPTGAQGIGQLEPWTVQAMQTQLHDPYLNVLVASDNIEMSAAFLSDLLGNTGGNAALALAGYYQGAESLRLVGMFPSTVRYVDGISSFVRDFS